MSTIDYDLTKIKAFIFDVDGVLSPDSVPLSTEGEPLRIVNIKDGYAIRAAAKSGYGLAIITGGNTQSVYNRFFALGIKDIYMASSVKIVDFNDYIAKTGYKPEEIIYAGDDIPDYQVMQQVGLSVAPANAVPEILKIATYISHKNGGDGIARDIIEQVMKAQGKWMEDDKAFGW
ncbi:MAG: KdsC family phosphatase [Dysgonomonas sp.]